MDIIQLLLKEFDEESARTKRMLERIPEDKWDWKPHEKSTSLKNLVVHLAELPSWVTSGLNTDGMNFADNPYKPTEVHSKDDVLQLHQRSVEKGRASLENATEEDLNKTWSLKNGDHVLMTMTKYEMVRHSFQQTTHHRAQLGVYLRLLNIPIPGTYGPSADEGF